MSPRRALMDPKHLRSLLSKKGKSVQSIAEDLGVSPVVVYQTLRGKYSLRTRAKVCEILGMGEFEAFDYVDCLASWQKTYGVGWKQAKREYDFCRKLRKYPQLGNNRKETKKLKYTFLFKNKYFRKNND